MNSIQDFAQNLFLLETLHLLADRATRAARCRVIGKYFEYFEIERRPIERTPTTTIKSQNAFAHYELDLIYPTPSSTK